MNQELETEVSEENEVRSLFDVLTIFSQTQPSSSSDNVYENELDEIMDEMAAVVGEVGADDYDAMKSIVDNWISMEESEVYMEMMREEVEELMDIDVLCGFKGIDEEDGDTDEDAIEDAERRNPDLDEINDLVDRIKSLSVQIGGLHSDYNKCVVNLDNAAEGLRMTFRRAENKKKSAKDNSARQCTMNSFFQSKKKSDK